MPLRTLNNRPALLVAIAALLLVASCGGGASPVPTRNGDAFLQQQLVLLDSMAVPNGVDLATWSELTENLRTQITARLEGKLPAATASANASAAVVTYDDVQGTLSWGFTSQGDYDQNGEVNAADLTPIAVNYQVNTGGAGPFPIGTSRSVVDGDSNGEINAADITPIAQNLGRSLFSYSVYAADSVAELPASNTAPNGAGAQLVETVPLSAAAGAANQERLQFTSDVSALDPQFDVFWVRPNDAPDGSGSDGTPSAAVGPGAPQVTSISGTVKTDADVALAGVTMSLSGPGNFNTTTAANGTFSFTGIPAGSYTLTPSKATCAFTPATRTVTSGSGKDFTASLDVADTPYGITMDDPLNPGTPVVLRFEKGTTIDVFVDSSGLGIPGWQASFDAAIRDASMIWNEVGQPWGLFTIRQTMVEAEAEIVVSWVLPFNDPLSPGKFAQTLLGVSSPPPAYTVPVPIQVATSNTFGPASDAIIRMIAVHEMGHALGLGVHSDLDTDIMFFSVSTFEQPSPRDILTMYTLYNTPADYSAGARGTSSLEPGQKTATIRIE